MIEDRSSSVVLAFGGDEVVGGQGWALNPEGDWTKAKDIHGGLLAEVNLDTPTSIAVCRGDAAQGVSCVGRG